jgi:hypothetical protein
VKDRDTGEAFDAADGVGPFCAARSEHHGLILRAIGDTISFCPPLIIDRAEIEEMIAKGLRPEPQSLRQINDGRNVTSGGKTASATMPSRNSPTNGHAALKASEIVTLSAAPWKANIT